MRGNLMETVCDYLPNCGKAMQLVETGCSRDLTLLEKLRLKYHGRLCPFCGCATGKFDSARNRYHDAIKQRQENQRATPQRLVKG